MSQPAPQPQPDAPLQVVLVNPEIPPNTGNIARLCAATRTPLHLVHPLGFSVDDRHLRRAGLDYWRHVSVHHHQSLDDALTAGGSGTADTIIPVQSMYSVFGVTVSASADSLMLDPRGLGLNGATVVVSNAHGADTVSITGFGRVVR